MQKRSIGMSVESYTGQSKLFITHDVAYDQCRVTNYHSSVYKASWSKKGHLRKVDIKCKYSGLFARCNALFAAY